MQQFLSTMKRSDCALESGKHLEWSQNLSNLPDLSTICHQSIEQIVTQLSVIGGWIVFQGRNEQQREWISYFSSKTATFDPATLSYLKSEAWLSQELPASRLIPLHFHIPASPETLEQPSPAIIYIYVYIFSNLPSLSAALTELKFREYVLVWCEHPLSESQQNYTEQQAKLIDNYLKIAIEHQRQQDKIHLLEQVIRKGEHQLRNPLALISLYAENLCLGLPTGTFQEQAQVIRDVVNELSTNLTHLLCCGQQHQLNLTVNKLSAIITESLQVLQPKIQEKQLHVQMSETPVMLNVDPWQIKQVFENLFSNAIELSPVGGTITCDWQVYKHEVLIEICDQGPGICSEDLPNIFNPFFTKRQGGTGLGLTIVKKIILDHQGSIWAENLLEGGAIFSFVLPR
jgi:signal transduction histidine kinase